MTTDARTALAEAEDEKHEAEALAAALAEKVRAGDTSVKAKDLTAARELAEFADLRIEAARRKLAQAAEDDRQARARLVADEVNRLLDEDDPREVPAAVRQVADAVRSLAQLAAARRARLADMGARVGAIAQELHAAHPERGERNRIMRETYGVGADRFGDKVATFAPHRVATSATVGELLAAAVALGTPDLADLQELRNIVGGVDPGTGRAFAAVPALADDWRLTTEEWQALPTEERRRAHSLHLAPPRDEATAAPA